MQPRKIIHVDMDAFFASVEQLDDPSLRGKPIAVGFDMPRSVVSTASYEARKWGVHSAQPMATAKRLCPSLVIVEPHFDRYKEISAQVHEIFAQYTHLIEPISIDEAFLERLPVEDLWGVGPKTAKRFHDMMIFTVGQLRELSLQYLTSEFGKMGAIYYNYARGIDERPVTVDYVRKSIGCENTFMTDIDKKSAAIIELYHTVLQLVDRIARHDFEGRTLTLKVKFADFTQITRSITQAKVLRDKSDILPLAKQLLRKVDYTHHPIRLLGLSVSRSEGDHNEGTEPHWHVGELPFEPY